MRSIVILPENFSGPWAMGFSCPMTVYTTAGERRLAVLVTDPNITLPAEGKVLELGPLDTLNGTLSRAELTRTRPAPPAPEPVVVAVVPAPLGDITYLSVVNPPEPVIVTVLPVEEAPPAPRAPRKKPSTLSRLKSFFRR